jgi:TolA-binding protein
MGHDNVDDLIALARRGKLGEPEARRLEMVLKTSDTTRALYEVGASFDRTLTGRSGDEELLARVRDRVTARVATRVVAGAPPLRQRRRLLALALLVAGGAAASVVGLPTFTSRGQGQTAALGSSVPTASTGTSATAKLGPAVPTRHEADVRDGERVGKNEPGARSTAAGAPQPTSHVPNAVSASELTARELFATGNAARKSGAQANALATYHKLQQTFPGSPEARLSQVLSGRMLLGLGRTDAALAQFDRYLAGGAEGGLAEEALWGKAQALSRLGRTGDERRVWRTLLARFPKSVYATTARQRLER